MSTLLSSAPGKVMIAGEYAVLIGQDAIVATIDRLAHCRYQEGSERFFSKMGDGFILDNYHPLYQAVKKTCQIVGLSLATGEYYLDSSDFFSHGHKIGLGSSAAAVVALCKIAFLQHGLSDSNLLFAIAHQAHQVFNTPQGSGADIAAAISGGIIVFNARDPQGKMHQLSGLWPSICIVATGRPQSSADFIKHFFELDAHTLKHFAEQSQRIVVKLANQPHSFQLLKESFIKLYDLLEQLGQNLGCDIISSEHKAIAEIAHFYGGAAKPSGAGGGDIAVVALPKAQQSEFEQEINNYGFSLLRTTLSSFCASSNLK